jgi:hypothetical protein
MVAALSLAPAARGQAPVSESELKAALVYNFARFIEWPDQAFASADAPMHLCLIGGDRMGSAFATIEKRKVQGRALKLRIGITADEAIGCHVAFVGEMAQRQLPATLRALSGRPVLTVSDIEGFIDLGGGIGIVQGEQRLQFEVNRTALDLAELRASSQLLKLARAVLGKGN